MLTKSFLYFAHMVKNYTIEHDVKLSYLKVFTKQKYNFLCLTQNITQVLKWCVDYGICITH